MMTRGTLGFSFGWVGWGVSWAYQHIRIGLIEIWWRSGSLRRSLMKQRQALMEAAAELKRLR